MNRLHIAVVGSVLGLVLQAGTVLAQDRITFFDRELKKEDTVTGTITGESPGQVTVKPSAGPATREIPAGDIQDIIYDVPGRSRLDYRAALGDEKKVDTAASPEERKKALDDAIKTYQK